MSVCDVLASGQFLSPSLCVPQGWNSVPKSRDLDFRAAVTYLLFRKHVEWGGGRKKCIFKVYSILFSVVYSSYFSFRCFKKKKKTLFLPLGDRRADR